MCCVVEADCSDLISSSFRGLLDQLWIFFLVLKGMMFSKAGVGAQQRETTTFLCWILSCIPTRGQFPVGLTAGRCCTAGDKPGLRLHSTSSTLVKKTTGCIFLNKKWDLHIFLSVIFKRERKKPAALGFGTGRGSSSLLLASPSQEDSLFVWFFFPLFLIFKKQKLLLFCMMCMQTYRNSFLKLFSAISSIFL